MDKTSSKKTVMVIDDSFTVRLVVKLALKNAGYNVIEAIDGKDAMYKLEGNKVNMFVCDVNMPNMDGITFVKNLRSIREYKFAPILMLTTESAVSKMEEGRAVGVNSWMVKPFKPDQVLDAVSKLCRA